MFHNSGDLEFLVEKFDLISDVDPFGLRPQIIDDDLVRIEKLRIAMEVFPSDPIAGRTAVDRLLVIATEQPADFAK